MALAGHFRKIPSYAGRKAALASKSGENLKNLKKMAVFANNIAAISGIVSQNGA
ncbi:MAG: hypothetical protein ACRBBK_10210 [Paracoccaceae bacterium]